MGIFSEDKRNTIIKILEERGVLLPCPRCSKNEFELLDGYFNQPIQGALPGMVLGGPSVPSIGVVCKNCGFISQHALGALGLMPESKSEPHKEEVQK